MNAFVTLPDVHVNFDSMGIKGLIMGSWGDHIGETPDYVEKYVFLRDKTVNLSTLQTFIPPFVLNKIRNCLTKEEINKIMSQTKHFDDSFQYEPNTFARY